MLAVQAAMAAPRAASEKIRIAVIDTGADLKHARLRGGLWTNSGEAGLDKNGRDKAANGIDDDGNGFIDDVHGWNFINGSNDLADRHGHGTHIGGIIREVEPRAELMVLKYFDPLHPSVDTISTTAKAIRYAVKMGAHIINYSAGGRERNPAEEEAVREAWEKGVLVVAAAGNEGKNSDLSGYYPAGYHLPNIVSVASLNPLGSLLSSSNFGARTVSLGAPGLAIVSALPGGGVGAMTGTSQATAFVSGAAARSLAENRAYRGDPERLGASLALTGNLSDSLKGKTKHGTSLDIPRASAMKDIGTAAMGHAAINAASIDALFDLQGDGLTD